jgi:hypothetical protein
MKITSHDGVHLENKFDIVTIVIAACVAGYAALAITYVAQYGLGFSLEAIRDVALMIAIALGVLITVDFLGEKGKA